MRIPPSIGAEMLTIAVCTHADCAERASMVSGDCDPGFWEADIDGDELCENPDACGNCSVVRTETRCV